VTTGAPSEDVTSRELIGVVMIRGRRYVLGDREAGPRHAMPRPASSPWQPFVVPAASKATPRLQGFQEPDRPRLARARANEALRFEGMPDGVVVEAERAGDRPDAPVLGVVQPADLPRAAPGRSSDPLSVVASGGDARAPAWCGGRSGRDGRSGHSEDG
jgi:hypothetical protein